MLESFYVGVWKAEREWKGLKRLKIALLLWQDKASFGTRVVLP
jgi:hypothetical protein